ncbi:DUF1549 domain-containing protein, partial [Prosthecobacter sp.]|uniref:DUF1549 domain-containing protein n=1 Tax=Prosthecobacter sp. TaxID=1965333 RepID=UPI001DDBC339
MKNSFSRLPVLLRVIAAVAMGGAVSAWATPANKKAAANYFDHFLPATLADCTLCHLPSTNHAPESLEEFPHNAFGKELAAIKKKSLPERLKQIADKDSDADGVSNLVEILLGGHPGDAKVKPESLAQLDSKREAFDIFLARYAWEPFKPVKRPKIPEPGVANPIDAFIDEQLQVHELKPLGEAVPAHIARRVYVDLIGLLPTPVQVA